MRVKNTIPDYEKKEERDILIQRKYLTLQKSIYRKSREKKNKEETKK